MATVPQHGRWWDVESLLWIGVAALSTPISSPIVRWIVLGMLLSVAANNDNDNDDNDNDNDNDNDDNDNDNNDDNDDNDNNNNNDNIWRQPTRYYNNYGDLQGFTMSVIVLPILLEKLGRTSFARIAALSPTRTEGIVALLVLSTVDPKYPSVFCRMSLSWIVVFHSLRWFPSMQGVWTRGEWHIVSGLLAVACAEWVSWNSNNGGVSEDTLHGYVALTGVLGCLLGCVVSTTIPNLPLKLVCLVGVPLGLIERSLTGIQGFQQRPQPSCLYWIWDFLMDHEAESGVQRFYFLLYWVKVLVVSSLVALVASQRTTAATVTAVVVTRKWFHLIAILLFAPVTVFAPQLMVLSYAIALCVLVVLESIRNEVVPIQTFFQNYLDLDNKDQSGTKVVISHMALIVGCALPLWIARVRNQQDSDGNNFVALWGIVILGVGDSMGAIVGTRYGKTKWGRNRSIEGSLAVWISTALCCNLLTNHAHLLVVSVVTCLEAFTSQIDNLTLPLAGVLLLLK